MYIKKNYFSIKWIIDKKREVFSYKVNNNIVVKVLKNEKERTTIPVFNFTVERDNTYTVGNYVVHNCQDFSLAGRREGLKGSKSSLIQHAIALIADIRPSIFIWENVKGAFSSNARADFWAILQAFANIGGYTIEWQLLNTSWVLPQNRERIYLVGHLAGRSEPGVFPIREVTEDSCKKTRNIYDYSRTILRGYKNSSSTGSFIKTKDNKIRYLTEIECELLQGFSENWTQYGDYNGTIKPIAKTQRYKLIGNAVTVDIVELIAKRLKFIEP